MTTEKIVYITHCVKRSEKCLHFTHCRWVIKTRRPSRPLGCLDLNRHCWSRLQRRFHIYSAPSEFVDPDHLRQSVLVASLSWCCRSCLTAIRSGSRCRILCCPPPGVLSSWNHSRRRSQGERRHPPPPTHTHTHEHWLYYIPYNCCKRTEANKSNKSLIFHDPLQSMWQKYLQLTC